MPDFKTSLGRIRGWFVENWPVKATALLLAALLWVLTTTREPRQELVRVNLVVEPPEGRALREPLPEVRALFTGSSGEILKLYGQGPTIHSEIPDTTGSEYTLEIGPGDLTGYADADVRPQDVQPRIITVRLDELRQRTVPVIHRVSVRPDSGFALFGGIAVQPSSLIVRGPEVRIGSLDALYTVPLTVTGAQQTVRRSVAIDTTGLSPVRISRNEVEVVADIAPLSDRVLSGVTVEIRDVQDGRWVAEPETVSVSLQGPTARLAGLSLDSVTVVAFVTGQADQQTVVVSVITPSGIRATTRPDSVTIRRRRG